jgi:drug/metabolite transporter (DMT)-like permease
MWSTVASAFKITLRYLDFIQMLLYASATSVLVLGFILVVKGKFELVFACTGREYLRSLILGLLNPFLYYLVLFKAYDLLPAQVAQPLNYTWAITLSLLSIPLLKQRLGAGDIVGGLVSYSGVLIISTRGDLLGFELESPLGVALALGSTIIWALYWIYNTSDARDPVVALFLNFLFGVPVVLAACLLFSDLTPSAPAGLIGAAYVGVVEMGISFVLWLNALKLSVNTAKVGNLIFISPFLSLVFIHFLVGEDILVSTYSGLVLIVLGLAIQRLKIRSHRT